MMYRLAAVGIAVVLAVGGSVAGATEGSPDVEAGERVFAANCAMCHGRDASGMMGMHPSLRGAVDRLTREGVEVTVRNGRDTNPPMPAFEGRLDDRQIARVIAYLDTLPSGPRNFGPGADGGGMMDGMMDGMGGWMMLAPILLILVVAAGIGAAVVVRRSGGRGTGSSTAREILDRRYAEGEIDREEYLQLREDLEK